MKRPNRLMLTTSGITLQQLVDTDGELPPAPITAACFERMVG